MTAEPKVKALCERCGFVARSLPAHCQCPDCCYPLTVMGGPDLLTVSFVLIGGGAGALVICALHWLGVLK